jgi:hypothetical protein
MSRSDHDGVCFDGMSSVRLGHEKYWDHEHSPAHREDETENDEHHGERT